MSKETSGEVLMRWYDLLQWKLKRWWELMDLDVDMEQKYTIYSIPQQDLVYMY